MARVLTLVYKELCAAFSEKSRFFIRILIDVLYIVIGGVALQAMIGNRELFPGVNYIEYLVLGMIFHRIFADTMSETSISLFSDQRSGMLGLLLVALEDPKYIIVGKFLSSTIIGIIGGLTLLASLAVVMPCLLAKSNILALITCIVFSSLVYASFSMLLATIAVTPERLNLILNIFGNVVAFMSNVFYPLEYIPAIFHPVVYANPMTYVVTLARFYTLGVNELPWDSLSLIAIILIYTFVSIIISIKRIYKLIEETRL